MALKNIRPYVISSHIQWIDDSGERPHIIVLNGEGVLFPPHMEHESALTFNVSSDAVQNLEIDDDGVSFTARFQGSVFRVHAPLNAVVAIRDGDSNVLISFTIEQIEEQEETPQKARPTLSVVSQRENPTEAPTNTESRPVHKGLHLVKPSKK